LGCVCSAIASPFRLSFSFAGRKTKWDVLFWCKQRNRSSRLQVSKNGDDENSILLFFCLDTKERKDQVFLKANAGHRKTFALQALILLAEKSWVEFAPQLHRHSV